MSMLSVYLRVIALLAPEKWLAITLTLANLAVAVRAERIDAGSR